MADEWPRVTIQALIESGAIVGHKDGNHGSMYPRVEEFGPVGVPFLTAKNLNDGNIDIKGAPRLADAKADALRIGFVKPNDVLLSHNATIGRVAVMPQCEGRVLIGTSLTYFRVDPARIEPRYLAAFFTGRDFQNQLAAVMSQTTRNQVPITSQRTLSVILPPLSEQKAIARILGKLDDKIELNRRMNATLEAMARALFQSWFVDFDPVHAKAAGRQPSGMEAATAALFPASFQSSELDEIPKGWTVQPLSELCSYLSRGIGPSYLEAGGVLVLNQKCIRDHRVNHDLGRRHNDQKKSIKGRLVERFDVLVNSTGVGTLGRVAQVLQLSEPTIVDSHVTIVRAAAGTDSLFLGVYLTGRESEIEGLGEGSTGQTELSRIRLGTLPVLTPPFGIQSTFGRFVRPIFDRIAANENQSRTLATLRDTVLPRLLNGELRARTN